MKKILFLLLFGLFVFIPKDTFARPISYQDGGMFYSKQKATSSSSIVTKNVSFASGFFPTTTISTSAPYSMNHNAVEFILINNSGDMRGASYTATVTFKYLFEGIKSNLLTDTDVFEGYINPKNATLDTSRSTINISPNPLNPVNGNGGVITIKTQGNLTQTGDLDKFTIGLVDVTGNIGIASCDNGSTSKVDCGNASNNIVGQISLVDFEIKVSQNINEGLLNSISENQEITNEKLDKTNEELGELNDNITSEDPPDLDALEDSAGWLPPGPVDSILNLPLTFFNNLISNLSKSCQPVEIPLPYVSKNLTLPCISTLYAQIGATTFLNWVGLIVGTIILYNYFLNLYKWIDDTIQMKDNSVDDWGGV